jgi:hypothetical protein
MVAATHKNCRRVSVGGAHRVGAGAFAIEVEDNSRRIAKVAPANVLGLRWLRRTRHHRIRIDLLVQCRRAGQRNDIGPVDLWIHGRFLGDSIESATGPGCARTYHRVVAQGGVSLVDGVICVFHDCVWIGGAVVNRTLARGQSFL